MAGASSPPYSRALRVAYYAQGNNELPVVPDNVTEHPGYGLEMTIDEKRYRLGLETWVKLRQFDNAASTRELSVGKESPAALSKSILTRNGLQIAEFHYQDSPRSEAASTITTLRQRGFDIHCLSGDRDRP